MGKFKTGCLGVVGVLIAIALIGSCAGGGSKDKSESTSSTSSSSNTSSSQAKQKVYNDADVNTLIKEAKENAAAANNNYKDKDIKIIGGKIDNIDSDLKYLTIEGTDPNYSMIHICIFAYICHPIGGNNKMATQSVFYV